MQKSLDPAHFVRILAPALREAAAIARSLEGRVANRPKAGEATPVKAALTVADTAAQEALLGPLLAHFPGVTLEAEEDTPTARAFSGEGVGQVVLDPIDGTLRFYLEALGPYAVMIGLALEGRYEAALVGLPREEIFFDAVRGAGSRIVAGETSPPAPARVSADGRRVLVSHDLPAAAVERLLAAGFEVRPASGGAISVAPLLTGVRAGLRYVRSGNVSVRGRVGALVASEAGALVRTAEGTPFPENIRQPERALLVACHEQDLQVLVEAVREVER
ncbi:MAG: inositol monophosphatase family protein [Myxococcota bacterium]